MTRTLPALAAACRRLGLVEQMSLHVGGCAANTGIDLAKLGVDTAVLGKVGADGDPLGREDVLGALMIDGDVFVERLDQDLRDGARASDRDREGPERTPAA